MTGSRRRNGRGQRGFTLAELIVASMLMTIVMTAVYVAFANTIREWRVAESNMQTYQDARTAITIMNRELNCILGGTQYLFQGEDKEFEFITVAPPMDVDEGEGPRVLWVRYHYDGAGHALVRQEALIDGPVPVQPKDMDNFDLGRIKMGRKKSFDIASNVRGLNVTYKWIPPHELHPDEPPKWLDPIVMEKNELGWGLPQSLEIKITLSDPEDRKNRKAFTTAVAFRGPTTPYDEKKMGEQGAFQ